MEEILYHLSQHWDNLQVQFDSGVRQIRNTVVQEWSSLSQMLYNCPWRDQCKLVFEKVINPIQNAVMKCAVVLAQPNDVYVQITDLIKVEMPIVYAGAVGFATGTLVGVVIGMSWRKVLPCRRMKAVVSVTYDGLDSLACVDDAIIPTLRHPNEILVHVKSASVDVVDIKISYGYGRLLRRLLNHNLEGELPVVLGRDCTGVVVEIGAKVNKFDIGDEVWLVAPFWRPGTIAEYVLTTEDMASKKPSRLTFEAAASIPYAGCLAYDACLKAGIMNNRNGVKRVLIHSGLSPVGCIACQLAKLNNCEVTVTCTANAGPVAQFLKADRIVIYGQIEMENNLAQDRFDVVLNTVGGVCYESCLKLCKPDGVVVSTVPKRAYDDNFPFSIFSSVFLRVEYFFKKLWKGRNQWDDVNYSGEVLEKLRDLVDSRLLTPVVDKIFEPEDAMLALQHCDSVHAIGKTIIQIR